jgi:predicted RNase H-like HicB family nuclease
MPKKNPEMNSAGRAGTATRRGIRLKVVIYEDKEGGFTAEVPALPGCVTEGDTREELLVNLREAVEGCLLAGFGAYTPEPGGREEEIEL